MSDLKVIIREETDNTAKLDAMRECDSAFPISIISRPHFGEIFRKISENAVFLKAVEQTDSEEKCLGFAAVYVNDHESKTAYVSLISVKEEAQGRHIGSMLIKRCFETAIANGMNKIRLEVLNSNSKAITFYKHYGFETESYTQSDTQYMIRLLKKHHEIDYKKFCGSDLL